jgi:hypothetical protein
MTPTRAGMPVQGGAAVVIDPKKFDAQVPSQTQIQNPKPQSFRAQALGRLFAELAKSQAKFGGPARQQQQQQQQQQNSSSAAPSTLPDDMVSNNGSSSFAVGRDGVVGSLLCGATPLAPSSLSAAAAAAAAAAPSFALTSTRLLWISPSSSSSSSSSARPPEVHCLPLLSIGTLKQGAG